MAHVESCGHSCAIHGPLLPAQPSGRMLRLGQPPPARACGRGARDHWRWSMVARDFIKRHPAAIYFALAYGISWGGIVLLLGWQGIWRGTLPTSQFAFVW